MTHASLPGLRHTQNLGVVLTPSLSSGVRVGGCLGESLRLLTFHCKGEAQTGCELSPPVPFLISFVLKDEENWDDPIHAEK